MEAYGSVFEILADLTDFARVKAAAQRTKAAALWANLSLDDVAGRIETKCIKRYGKYSLETVNGLCREVACQHDLSVYKAKQLPPREFIRLADELPAIVLSAANADKVLAAATIARKKAKRSTERGEGRTKLIPALTKHHQYADGSCLNLEHIGNNELATLAEVSPSTASDFFKKEFGGHTKYRAACRDATRLVPALKLLNQEFSPYLLFGAKPPGDDERDNDE